MRLGTLGALTPLMLSLLALPGCEFGDGGGVELKTSGGHILDSRAWALGSTVGLNANTSAPRGLTMTIEGKDGIEPIDTSTGYYGGSDATSMPSIFGGWASIDGTVTEVGEFDVVVTGSLGREIERVTMQTEEPVDYALGILLDDCPEFPDLVLWDAPTFIEGSYVNLAPTPLDASGQQLIGHFDYELESDLGLEGTWGGTIGTAGEGTVTVTVGDVVRDFQVNTVTAAEVVELEILGLPEKHGYAAESLLCAVGKTADGRLVHGIDADWSKGWTAQTIHAENGESVSACFAGNCATWNGPDVP